MICPNCSNINKDDARECRVCGMRINAKNVRPESKEKEKKYLLAGIAALLVILITVTFVTCSVSCICGGCEEQGGEEHINENVDGDWDAEVSSGDVVYEDGTGQGSGEE